MSALPDPAFWSGRRVLVTGDTGFKGGWLSLWLTEMGAEVVGFADAVPTEPSLWEAAGVGAFVEHHAGDVRDAARVAEVVGAARAEVVFHLAAQPMVRRSYAEPAETFATNLMGTVHVLDALRGAGGSDARVCVVVTTDKVYDNREWPWGYREDEPLGGRDPYASSKAAAELATAAYKASFFGAGDACAIASARAGNVIGGGDWGEDRLVPDIFRAVAAGRPVRIRNPHAIRPWQHVLNPLSGYLVLAERAWRDRSLAQAYNFGPSDDDVRPVGWVVEQLAVHSEIDPGPHPHEAHWLKLDSSLARTTLGWSPTWDLADGLRATADWYRAHRDGEDVLALTRAQIAAFGAG
jgi:CDP-glucose 4,6-dehydratase